MSEVRTVTVVAERAMELTTPGPDGSPQTRDVPSSRAHLTREDGERTLCDLDCGDWLRFPHMDLPAQVAGGCVECRYLHETR